MIFNINTAYFSKLLKPITSGAYSSETVWLNATADFLNATVVTKRRVTASVSVKCRDNPVLDYLCQSPGSGAINARILQKNLAAMRSATISVEFPEMASMTSLPDRSEEQTFHMSNSISISTDMVNCNSDQKFKITAKTLMDGLLAVKHAMGIETTRPHYCGILLEMGKDSCRFIAGNGAFFAIKSIKNKNLIRNKNDKRLFLSSECVATILSSLAAIPDQLLECKVISNNNVIVISSPNVLLYVDNMLDSAKNYPSVDKVLDYNYPHKLYVDTEEFKYAAAGMAATYTKEEQRCVYIWTIEMIVDIVAGQILFKKDTKALRKVPLNLNTISVGAAEPINLKCQSGYLTRAYRQFRSSKELIIRCENKNQPIVIESVNRAASKGNYDIIFFGSSKRE